MVAQPLAHEGLVELRAIVHGVDDAVAFVELADVAARAEADHQAIAHAHLAKWHVERREVGVYE